MQKPKRLPAEVRGNKDPISDPNLTVAIMVEKEQEIQSLREEIEEIIASLPAHSVMAGTLQRLEELEERLEELVVGGEDAPA